MPEERDYFRRNGLDPVDVQPANVTMCVCKEDEDGDTIECGDVNEQDTGINLELKES